MAQARRKVFRKEAGMSIISNDDDSDVMDEDLIEDDDTGNGFVG